MPPIIGMPAAAVPVMVAMPTAAVAGVVIAAMLCIGGSGRYRQRNRRQYSRAQRRGSAKISEAFDDAHLSLPITAAPNNLGIDPICFGLLGR